MPAAIRIMSAIVRGQTPRRFSAEAFEVGSDASTIEPAWAGIRSENRSLALRAQALVSEALGTEPPVPPSMTGCIAMIALPPLEPEAWDQLASTPTKYADPLQDALIRRWRTQVPVVHPARDADGRPMPRCVRVSAQLYNSESQYRHLAGALVEALAEERGTPVQRRYNA